MNINVYTKKYVLALLLALMPLSMQAGFFDSISEWFSQRSPVTRYALVATVGAAAALLAQKIYSYAYNPEEQSPAPEQITEEVYAPAPIYNQTITGANANVCYINSVISLFAYIPQIQQLSTENFSYSGDDSELKKHYTIINEWQKLLIKLKQYDPKTYQPINADDFYALIQNQYDLQAGRQNDPHELLTQLINSYKEVENRQDKSTVLQSLFSFVCNSQSSCKKCDEQFKKQEYANIIELAIPSEGKSSLDQCMAQYFAPEKIDDKENYIECSQCKEKTGRNKNMKLKSLPTLLPIQLKRYLNVQENSSWTLKKLPTPITLPETFDFGTYLQDKTTQLYALAGFVTHRGETIDSGHYMAYIKKNNTWWRCNDELVTQVDNIKEVLASETENISGTPYLLMYVKKND